MASPNVLLNWSVSSCLEKSAQRDSRERALKDRSSLKDLNSCLIRLTSLCLRRISLKKPSTSRLAS